MSAKLFVIKLVHFTISCSNSTWATRPFLIWLNYSCLGCSVSRRKTRLSIIWPCHSFISYAILQLILIPSLYLLIYLIYFSRHTFVRLLGYFDEIWRKSVISIYPINSLRVYVFLPKSNEKFYLMKVRKQLAPRQEIIISPPEIANHWDKGTFWRQRR